MFSRRQLFDYLLLLCLSSAVFLICLTQGAVGLWEPWETSTILAAQHISQTSIVEAAFWVPQVEGSYVAQPYLQLWILAGLLHLFPDPGAFLLRLPGAVAGIVLVLLTFFAVRQASTRRAAWVTALVLLTLPMFVLSGKFIHGDVWLIFAVSLPNLFYISACYASTRRMHRAFVALTALSVFLSFLSGGLYALALLGLECVVTVLLVWHHPEKKVMFRPLSTRFFLVPLYIAFLLSGIVFGIHVSEARYILENRIPMTLVEINDALDEDRVISIERRGKQIIGTLRVASDDMSGNRSRNFILVETVRNLNTDSTDIFNINESERHAFENYLMWRFQKKAPARAQSDVPPIDGAFETAFRFFWYHTNSPETQASAPMARVVSETPVRIHRRSNVSSSMAFKSAVEFAEAALDSTYVLAPGALVYVTGGELSERFVEIRTGDGIEGAVETASLSPLVQERSFKWRSWIDMLMTGLFPWGCFFPVIVICALIASKRLCVAGNIFNGEFQFSAMEAAGESRSPLQSLLLSWLIVSLFALFLGIEQSGHDFFAGMIPVAILIALALSSPRFWHDVRKTLEARGGFVLIAVVCLCVIVYFFHVEPFRLVRYLMTDPLMHWDGAGTRFFDQYVVRIFSYVVIFIVLTILSFTRAAEGIQEKVTEFKETYFKPSVEVKSTSSASLMRVSREDVGPMPYAPVISLVLAASLSASFIYYTYLPAIADNFTETSLIDAYFRLADQSEPVYLLKGENSQLCQTYRDCEPGYVCQNRHCNISTFASYSLNVAKPVTRAEMVKALSPASVSQQPAFYIMPKDMLFGINQAYRGMYPSGKRKNLTVVEAASSRLYLIGNHKDVRSVNPLDQSFMNALPVEGVSKRQVALEEGVTLEGFKIDKLVTGGGNLLELTVYYRLSHELERTAYFAFALDVANRKLEFKKPLYGDPALQARLLPGDIIADRIRFDLPMLPAQGSIGIRIGMADQGMERDLTLLTTIDF